MKLNKIKQDKKAHADELDTLINFNDLPKTIGILKNGDRWYAPSDIPKIVEHCKSKLPDVPDSTKLIGTLAGRLPQSITLLVAFALAPYVDELRYSGTNFPTVTVYPGRG